eukprot:TRINITY_DN2991_c2_g1_i1.p1 TRINITY_DN2991_c2_g1~~TRINITY_DN2991_c2_g1_i1.p1  ORF type:complete len:115 (+),score=13.30 TRINITY_DN2991_c2_g1_i1:149-493(+)
MSMHAKHSAVESELLPSLKRKWHPISLRAHVAISGLRTKYNYAFTKTIERSQLLLNWSGTQDLYDSNQFSSLRVHAGNISKNFYMQQGPQLEAFLQIGDILINQIIGWLAKEIN